MGKHLFTRLLNFINSNGYNSNFKIDYEKNKGKYSLDESMSNINQFKNRDELEKLFKQSPIPSDEIMTQLGLYIRGSYLVKFLVLNDLY